MRPSLLSLSLFRSPLHVDTSTLGGRDDQHKLKGRSPSRGTTSSHIGGSTSALAGSPNKTLYEKALQAAMDAEELADARSRSPNTRERVRQDILSNAPAAQSGYDAALQLGERMYGTFTPSDTQSTRGEEGGAGPMNSSVTAPPLSLGPSASETSGVASHSPSLSHTYPGPGPVARAMAQTPLGEPDPKTQRQGFDPSPTDNSNANRASFSAGMAMSAYHPGPIGGDSRWL